MSFNLIDRVSFDTFDDCPALQTLSLSHNLINQVDTGAFDALSNLTDMYLANNRLNFMPILTLPLLQTLFDWRIHWVLFLLFTFNGLHLQIYTPQWNSLAKLETFYVSSRAGDHLWRLQFDCNSNRFNLQIQSKPGFRVR